jgi:alkylation response protein AidB-like acyl-CoA dehydrogenase
MGTLEKKLGQKASDTREVIFENMALPQENLLGGKRGEGFKEFMRTLTGGRISIGAMALGLAEGACERSVAYAKERKAFGKPIAEHQAIAFKLADMATQIAAAKHLVYYAATLKDKGLPFAQAASMAKLFASEIAMKVTDDAIQVHGGYGYSREYEVERMYRDVKLCEIGEGTSEIQRLVISREIVKSAG